MRIQKYANEKYKTHSEITEKNKLSRSLFFRVFIVSRLTLEEQLRFRFFWRENDMIESLNTRKYRL